MISETSKQYLRLLTYLAGFFLTVHLAFPSYWNAKFLETFIDENNVGLVFSAAAILTIICTIYLPVLVRRFGLLKTLLASIVTAVILTLGLAFFNAPTWVIVGFIFYYTIGLLIRFLLDIYLEKVTDSRNTGNTRGAYLTFVNIAWLISPFLASSLIVEYGFRIIYIIAAIILIPMAYIVSRHLVEKEHHRQVPTSRLRVTIKNLLTRNDQRDKNLRYILSVDFLLNFFYAIMVIYMAIYLTEHVGLGLSQTGIIFTVMLLPFVLFDLPLGWLADRYLGEKEIMATGFVLTGVFTILISFLVTTSIAVWAFILFMTRVGAASIEIMKETYLFKKINEEDTDILALSRNMQPFSYIIGPLIASVFFVFFDFRFIFLFLGIVTLLGLIPTLKLKDTK